MDSVVRSLLLSTDDDDHEPMMTIIYQCVSCTVYTSFVDFEWYDADSLFHDVEDHGTNVSNISSFDDHSSSLFCKILLEFFKYKQTSVLYIWFEAKDVNVSVCCVFYLSKFTRWIS